MSQADMERRITCGQCQKQLSITWISLMVRCSFCQATIIITRNDSLSKEQRMSFCVTTKNQAPAIANSSGAEHGRCYQKLERCYGRLRNRNSGASIPSNDSTPSPARPTARVLNATATSNYKPYKTALSSLPSIVIRPKRRAVLCGVTYSKTRKYRLKGTLADVKNMKELLMRRFQFPAEGILVLTEEGKDDTLIPTRKNIHDALNWLVKDCESGDSLVFFFSGHGLRQPEYNGDERDGFDETICPVDFMEQGMILDDEINSMIVRPLIEGVVLHAIVDACHSGTILDLPHVYNPISKTWEDNSPPAGSYKGTNGGLAISFSACGDNEMAADTSAFAGKTMNGAMTYSFTKVINENPNITYGELLTTINQAITKANDVHCFNSRRLAQVFHKKISQEPLLSSSKPFDVNKTKFSFYPRI